jgi:hypothetical protein
MRAVTGGIRSAVVRAAYLADQMIRKGIVVPDRIVNLGKRAGVGIAPQKVGVQNAHP